MPQAHEPQSLLIAAIIIPPLSFALIIIWTLLSYNKAKNIIHQQQSHTLVNSLSENNFNSPVTPTLATTPFQPPPSPTFTIKTTISKNGSRVLSKRSTRLSAHYNNPHSSPALPVNEIHTTRKVTGFGTGEGEAEDYVDPVPEHQWVQYRTQFGQALSTPLNVSDETLDNPRPPAASSPSATALSPRASIEIFQPHIRRRSTTWSAKEFETVLTFSSTTQSHSPRRVANLGPPPTHPHPPRPPLSQMSTNITRSTSQGSSFGAYESGESWNSVQGLLTSHEIERRFSTSDTGYHARRQSQEPGAPIIPLSVIVPLSSSSSRKSNRNSVVYQRSSSVHDTPVNPVDTSLDPLVQSFVPGTTTSSFSDHHHHPQPSPTENFNPRPLRNSYSSADFYANFVHDSPIPVRYSHISHGPAPLPPRAPVSFSEDQHANPNARRRSSRPASLVLNTSRPTSLQATPLALLGKKRHYYYHSKTAPSSPTYSNMASTNTFGKQQMQPTSTTDRPLLKRSSTTTRLDLHLPRTQWSEEEKVEGEEKMRRVVVPEEELKDEIVMLDNFHSEDDDEEEVKGQRRPPVRPRLSWLPRQGSTGTLPSWDHVDRLKLANPDSCANPGRPSVESTLVAESPRS
ncbi:hypothetical protein T439DRAFT_355414 [Meredithblackwellia eburnea MCA 4105]